MESTIPKTDEHSDVLAGVVIFVLGVVIWIATSWLMIDANAYGYTPAEEPDPMMADDSIALSVIMGFGVAVVAGFMMAAVVGAKRATVRGWRMFRVWRSS